MSVVNWSSSWVVTYVFNFLMELSSAGDLTVPILLLHQISCSRDVSAEPVTTFRNVLPVLCNVGFDHPVRGKAGSRN